MEWSEINAAWGQTALLLWALARKVNITFNKYQVVPYGAFSYVKNLSDDKTLPLYGSGGFRMIFDSKFDMAMVAYLDCLNQFANEVQRHGAFSLPYEMDKGKIRDTNSGQWHSIKLQFNSEENWTKALRYMLTNLKWVIFYRLFALTSYRVLFLYHSRALPLSACNLVKKIRIQAVPARKLILDLKNTSGSVVLHYGHFFNEYIFPIFSFFYSCFWFYSSSFSMIYSLYSSVEAKSTAN